MFQNDTRVIAVIAIALVVLVGGGAWYFSRSIAPPANATPKAVTATEAPIDSKAAEKPVDLPPRDRMDPFLRSLLRELSNRPELANWVATDDLVGQLAMAIDQASTGASPARDFKALKPSGTFSARGSGPTRVIDPAGYKRYDGLVQTVTSIDASKVASIFRTIRPRLNEAYQQHGNAGRNVDAALVAALDILIDTPVVKDPIAVIGSGTDWAFRDDELEGLLPTQKQLLRMGPANAERLQAWLRALRDAL
jgi:hypothetical protein